MRVLVAFALAIALAGCTTASDDPAPPNADPNGNPPTYPPTNTTAPTASSPSTGSMTATSTPTYSSSPTSSPAPGVTLSAGHQEDTATHADFPGLLVAGQLDVTGNVAHFEATANNFGQRTYRVSSICVQPWSESMRSDSGPAAHRQPQSACTAFGLRDFAPGESIAFSAEWNGTLWQGSNGGGTYVPAPDGTYHWTASFQVYSGGSGASYDSAATLSLEFQVTAS